MRIGIVSDTHGRIAIQARALAVLADRSIEVLAHCGDLGSTQCLEQLTSLGVPVYAVLGNTDQAESEFTQAARACGAALGRKWLAVPLEAGRSAAVTHGNDAALLAELIRGESHAYVLHGHTHRARDEQIGGVRVINPGALHNSRSPGHPTVAVLDAAADTVEFLDVPDAP
jgi:hypothetical protein